MRFGSEVGKCLATGNDLAVGFQRVRCRNIGVSIKDLNFVDPGASQANLGALSG